MLAPGDRLGSYEITAKLGEGGMGEVYRATDTKLEHQVAIKVLPAAFTEDKERLARFKREAQLLIGAIGAASVPCITISPFSLPTHLSLGPGGWTDQNIVMVIHGTDATTCATRASACLP